MTAAYRLKGLGWFAGCAVVTLGFYLVSLQVAAERKRVELVNARIAVAERDIRALETEFDTRANLAQLEKWNGDTLALVAPVARQFVGDEAQLAAIRFDAAMPGGVQTANYVVPSLPAAPVTPPAAPQPPAIAIATAAVASPPPVPAKAPAADEARPAIRRAQAVAMLDRSLLSDATIGDLLSGARSERGRPR